MPAEPLDVEEAGRPSHATTVGDLRLSHATSAARDHDAWLPGGGFPAATFEQFSKSARRVFAPRSFTRANLLRLAALQMLVRLQLAMHAITCIAPALLAMAVRLALLRFSSGDASSGATLGSQDRDLRALFLSEGIDLGVWLGLRSWMREHAASTRGRVDPPSGIETFCRRDSRLHGISTR